MSDRPAFIDNRDGNTLARALREVLAAPRSDRVGDATVPPHEVRIATAFFSPSGFAQIAGALSRVPVRLLLGADRPADEPASRPPLGEPAGAFEQRRLGARLSRMDDGLRRGRDRLPYTRTSAKALRTLVAALRGGNMEVRRYERAFLDAKAYILTSVGDAFGAPEGVIAGSANLTAAGLSDNLELNLGRYDRPIVERARAWFDDLWEEAEPCDLADVLQSQPAAEGPATQPPRRRIHPYEPSGGRSGGPSHSSPRRAGVALAATGGDHAPRMVRVRRAARQGLGSFSSSAEFSIPGSNQSHRLRLCRRSRRRTSSWFAGWEWSQRAESLYSVESRRGGRGFG